MSGAPLLLITLTLTARAMEKTLSKDRTNRGGKRAKEERKAADENRGKRNRGSREIRKRRKRESKAKEKVKGRAQDRFLLEWLRLGRVVERFL